jgi:exodeoxyribonuclease-5
MEFSPKQDKALQQVDAWLKDPTAPQVFRLFGYAGTGKTTLAKHFSQNVDGLVLFGAFTGKAAYVLQQKGCNGAMTIHQMIYSSREKGQARLKELEANLLKLKQELVAQGIEGEQISENQRVKDFRRLIAEEKKNLLRPSFVLNKESVVSESSLVVIDECSMVDTRMGEDLLSFGKKVLVLGDPAQLPPVGGAGYFTENVTPDIMLDEIHRQAKDNPIIEMATRVRNQQELKIGSYGSSEVIPLSKINKEICLAADQLLVGRNSTRFVYNKRMRELLGKETLYPEKGDRLVCLRNNHDIGLLNGAIWNVEETHSIERDKSIMTLSPEGGGGSIRITAHSQHFVGQGKEIPFYEKKEAEEFDFGYALTCHKSQGSQWDKIVVFDESSAFRQDKFRWLYTAITRAAEKLQLVQM